MSPEETYQEGQDTRTETKRRCPYCSDEVYSRGLYAHVMNSEDEAHGNYRSVPDGFNPREAEIVGEEEREPREDPFGEAHLERRLYLCTLCGGMFKGEMGYKVHLAKVAGDDVHPQEIDVTDNHYVKIPADENWEPTIPEEELKEIEQAELETSPEEPEGGLEGGETVQAELGQSVPAAALRELVERFDGKGEAYEDAEEEVEEVIERYS